MWLRPPGSGSGSMGTSVASLAAHHQPVSPSLAGVPVPKGKLYLRSATRGSILLGQLSTRILAGMMLAGTSPADLWPYATLSSASPPSLEASSVLSRPLRRCHHARLLGLPPGSHRPFPFHWRALSDPLDPPRLGSEHVPCPVQPPQNPTALAAGSHACLMVTKHQSH